MINEDIREKVFKSEITYREIARAMNCRAEYLSRIMSKPLSEKNKKKILEALEIAGKSKT